MGNTYTCLGTYSLECNYTYYRGYTFNVNCSRTIKFFNRKFMCNDFDVFILFV